MSRARSGNTEVEYGSLVFKGILILIFLAALFVLNSNIAGIPINNSSIKKISSELSQKTQEIKKMNELIGEIERAEPELKSTAQKITENSDVAGSSNKKGILEVPSVLVYLEELGFETGLTIKKIDIVGLKNESAPETLAKDMPISANSGRQEFVISGGGSYDSFASFVKRLQINTEEKIYIEDFKLVPTDGTMNYCDIELRISL